MRLQGPDPQFSGFCPHGAMSDPPPIENPPGTDMRFETFLLPHSGHGAFEVGRGTRASNSSPHLSQVYS